MGSRLASAAIAGAIPAKSRSPLASPANLVVGSSTTAITSCAIARRPAECGREGIVPREHPALARNALHKLERSVSDRCEVERGPPHVGARDVAQQMLRENRKFAQHQRKLRLRNAKQKHSRRIIWCDDGIERRQICGTRVSGARVARGEQRVRNVTRGGRLPVVPAERADQPNRQRASIGAEHPGCCGVGFRRESAVVPRKRREQRKALHLPRERMDRHQRIAGFEIRPRRKHHDVRRARRPRTRHGAGRKGRDHHRRD